MKTIVTCKTFEKLLGELQTDFENQRSGFGGDGEAVNLEYIFAMLIERAEEVEGPDE